MVAEVISRALRGIETANFEFPLMGFAGEEVMGRNLVKDFITDDYKERVQDVFTKALEGRETANFEFPLVTKAGVSVRVLLNATTRRDDQGKAMGVVGIGQD